MHQSSTAFLKSIVLFIGITVLAICIFVLPPIIRMELAGDFDYAPILFGLYVPAAPFFFALYQALKLLNVIDKNQAFSSPSVQALKNIKHCAFIIAAIFAVGMPYIYYIGDRDDAPGIIAVGFIITFISLVIAAFAAVMQKLIQNAVDIKSENDLTV